jgi:glycosyltransferase involved in cell wall biosynthesis
MKDYPTFLQAAALITQKIPHTEFHLAGSGIDPTNTDLTQLIADLHLQNHVHLHGDHPDIPALTASLDLAVSSSAFGEGFPNVVGEAMACAVPVVATDIGDTAWVMGDTGTLVPPRDPQALATAALKILTLPVEQRQTLGHQGRTRIESHFSLPSILTHFDSLLSPSQISASFQLARPVAQAAGLPPCPGTAALPKVVQASCLHSHAPISPVAPPTTHYSPLTTHP